MDVSEGTGGGVEEIFEVHGLEAVQKGVHILEEGGVFFEESAAAARGAMSGAEFLAAFGDAAAFVACFVDVGAFFDHGFAPPGIKKPRRRGEAFCFSILSSEYQVGRE
jgi:hypothetical protein